MVENILQKLHWLGHDGFRIDAEKTIYIDPYQIKSTVPADIILVTHDHYDHCSPEDIKKIQRPTTVIVTDKSSAAKLSGDVRIVKPGDITTVQGISIEVVPAYNTNKQFHPKAAGMLGFIVTVQGVRIYHAGDSDFTPDMGTIKADIALLPVSGTYVMTAEEAVQAALRIKPRIAVPMHYGAIVGSRKDAQTFAQQLEGKIDVRILEQE
ncbi:MAG: MBL fold metallo-hydrolase [Desulfobacterota bacterium]|nr:MBL fold metallo-hydrolase [Thermodesulfobacteriota bacterium]